MWNYKIAIEQVGSPQWPRYVLRDNTDRYFTGNDWSPDPSQGLLFDDLTEVTQRRIALKRLLQPKQFEAVVRIMVNHDCEFDLDTLRRYLDDNTLILVNRSNPEAPERCFVVVDWETLRPTS